MGGGMEMACQESLTGRAYNALLTREATWWRGENAIRNAGAIERAERLRDLRGAGVL